MYANTSATKYDIVKHAVAAVGMKNVADPDDNDCVLIWSDSPLSGERVASLKAHQRVNHFVGMGEISRKDALARNMSALQQLDSENFSFTPQTWIFPGEACEFQRYLNEQPSRNSECYIAKPPNQAMGRGIRLYLNAHDIPRSEPLVVQRYISNPLLIDGYKFDLRIYVLVTSCDPLRVFLFPEGLVRFSTEKYAAPSQSNIYHRCMHLTNYSVNKDSDNYQKSTNNYHEGSKRSLDFLFTYLRTIKHPNANTLWGSIADLIIKTLIVAEPFIFDAYRVTRPFDHSSYNLNCMFDDIRDCDSTDTFFDDSVCFEVLGFDVLLDDTLKPWLLEVNRSPSFRTSEKIDVETKGNVLVDAFTLLNLKRLSRKNRRPANQTQHSRLIRYPYTSNKYSVTVSTYATLGHGESNSGSGSVAPSSLRVHNRTYSRKYLPPSNPALSPYVDLGNATSRQNTRSRSTRPDENDRLAELLPSGPLTCRSPMRRMATDRELEEMKNLLIRVRIQEDRFEYETSEACSKVRFKRIFPLGDHISQKRYTAMLKTSFQAFLETKVTDEFLKYLDVTYDCRLTEDDVKQMIDDRCKIQQNNANADLQTVPNTLRNPLVKRNNTRLSSHPVPSTSVDHAQRESDNALKRSGRR